jgi:hypothetical protein
MDREFHQRLRKKREQDMLLSLKPKKPRRLKKKLKLTVLNMTRPKSRSLSLKRESQS